MPIYDIFFFGALFFLLGILFASLNLKFWILIIAAGFAVIFLILRFLTRGKKWFLFFGFAFLIIFGAVYYEADNQKFLDIKIPFEEKTSFSGEILNQPSVKNNSQEFYLKLDSLLKGNVFVKASLYPQFGYGDKIKMSGKIKRPYVGSYANYLAKEKISGIVSFPEIGLVSRGNGNFIKAELFKIRGKIVRVFQQILPPKEAAFLTGLTLGGRSEFSEEFKRAMSLSGTTHLVALSGYNITILVWIVMGFFGYFLRRRTAYILTALFIVGFVLMAGAESSVVRAAIMGILALLAKEVGRFFDFRNAIILAALIMVLFNPKVLVYDVGFQLSFLALLGIIYLRPAIIKIFRISESPGFLSWRDNFLTTLSAQLAVMPLLIQNFGVFSPTSIFANVIILEIVPVTMIIGFIAAFASLFSYYFGLVFGWVLWIPLRFEIFVIELFAKLSLPIGMKLSAAAIFIYVFALCGFVFFANRKYKHERINL